MTIKLLKCSEQIKYSLKCVSSKPLLSYKRFNVCIIDENKNAILKSMIHSGNYEDYQEFYGPKLEKINRLLISPEDDAWILDGVKLEINNNQTIEFDSNMKINLFPLIENAIDAKKKDNNDKEYLKFKMSILFNTTILVSVGSIIDIRYTAPFIIGGIIGLLYMYLLQQEIDMIENTQKTKNIHSGRLLIILVGTSIILNNNKQILHNDYLIFLSGFSGFLMYRIGVLIALFQKN